MSHILAAIVTPLAAINMHGALSTLAGQLGASVTLLHLLSPGGAHPGATLAAGRETVEHLATTLAEEGVSCQTINIDRVDDIPGAILAAATDAGASLILMGISGKSAFARRVGGDLPTQLLSRTHLPVLLVPPAADGTL